MVCSSKADVCQIFCTNGNYRKATRLSTNWVWFSGISHRLCEIDCPMFLWLWTWSPCMGRNDLTQLLFTIINTFSCDRLRMQSIFLFPRSRQGNKGQTSNKTKLRRQFFLNILISNVFCFVSTTLNSKTGLPVMLDDCREAIRSTLFQVTFTTPRL